MANITASGLGSGLDINGLVSQLVAAERQPATQRLNSREAKLKAQISAIGSFKSALSSFQSVLAKLKTPDLFQSMKTTVADDKLLTVTAGNGAQTGTYNIKIDQLAQAHRLATPADQTFASASAMVGTGTLTFEFGTYDGATNSFTANPNKSTQTVTIDSSNNTLAGIRDAINQANIGVMASIINDGNGYRLVVGAKDSGAANSLKITVDDSSLSLLSFDPTSATDRNTKQTVTAANARIVVDGLTVTSASNTLNEAIPGVTLNLKATGTVATSLLVEQDNSGVTETLESLVKSYNDLMGNVKSLTSSNAGPLNGDYNVRFITNRIRSIFTSSITGVTGAFKSLADIGISLQRDGALKLDGARLQNALNSDVQGVTSLFVRAPVSADPSVKPDGVAQRLDDLLSDVLGGDGPLKGRTESLNKQVRRLDAERERLDTRMASLEERYRAQFTAMDKLVSQLTATGNFLTQQLSIFNNNSK